MKYGLNQLKSVADELLCALALGAERRNGIVAACMGQAAARRRTTWSWPIYSAAGLLACAVMVLAISSLVTPMSPPSATDPATGLAAQNEPAATPGEASEGPAVIVGATQTDGYLKPMGAADPGHTDDDTIVLNTASSHRTQDAGQNNNGYGYTVEKNEAGLFGLMNGDGEWVIDPEYDRGEIIDNEVVFTSGTQQYRFDLSEIED